MRLTGTALWPCARFWPSWGLKGLPSGSCRVSRLPALNTEARVYDSGLTNPSTCMKVSAMIKPAEAWTRSRSATASPKVLELHGG